MGQILHGSATTTEAVRRAIQHSQESLRGLAKRYGVNPKTVAKWKARSSVSDLPTGPKQPRSTVLSAEEEAVVVALAWATVAGHRTGDNPARWTGHLKELLPAKAKIAKTKHLAAIPYTEIPAFIGELRAKHGTSASALEFCILTAARTGEVISARWAEIDLNAKLWTVPATRMKSQVEHRVPLSDRAVAILETLPSKGEYVFP